MGEVGFDAFVVAETEGLLRLAYLLCGDQHLAEDLVQDALIKVHRRWDELVAEGYPLAYVRRVVVRENTSWWRRRSSHEKPGGPETKNLEGDWSVDPDVAMQISERMALWEQLQHLSAVQRTVMVLRYYQDMSDVEIADLVGCRRSTVRSHAARAIASLRTRIAQQAAAEVEHG